MFKKIGASWPINAEAMVSLPSWREAMSPRERWVKNSTGSLRTCHIKEALASIASLPSIFSQ